MVSITYYGCFNFNLALLVFTNFSQILSFDKKCIFLKVNIEIRYVIVKSGLNVSNLESQYRQAFTYNVRKT